MSVALSAASVTRKPALSHSHEKGWAQWSIAITIPLNVGDDTIRVLSSPRAGGPNVDRLTVK
jgi:hypothetical protein